MSSKLSDKKCPMCSFEAPTVKLVLNHLRNVHSNDPRFHVMCGIDGCARTYRKFSGLHSHLYRCHWTSSTRGTSQGLESTSAVTGADCMEISQPSDPGMTMDVVPETTQADIDYLLGDLSQQQRSSALFLLKLKEERRLTQVAIDDIVEGIETVLEQSVMRAKAGVRAKLATEGIDPDTVTGLDEVFSDITHPFGGLETGFKQEKYFRDELGLLEPEELNIGNPEIVPVFTGDKRKLIARCDTIQYVPILSTLENLLRDPCILDEIETLPRRMHSDGLLEDFCDGSLFQVHPLFSCDPCALQIIAYFDELEVCNPLGSHVKKHKLGLVFFSLGNIHPKLRSSLKAINLVAVASSIVIDKYGINKVLEPFVRDLNILATQGIKVAVNGRERVFRGALLAFLADNLASNALGGFKLSFSFSYRYCRTCLLPKNEVTSSFDSRNFVPRCTESHLKHCELLDGPNGAHHSTTYGINARSCLLDVKYFSLFGGGLPHDCMHDVLEGVGPKEIKLLLLHCVSSKFFTLEEYNERLASFNYGYSDNDRPVPILCTTFSKDTTMRSSAAQMLTLFRNLPFMVGPKIPEGDENWSCFLILRKILDIIMCPVIPSSTCATLKSLIIEHHTLYCLLYGNDQVIPKMHFLTHYPEQMMAIGPIMRAWTMRHEAKLNFFKQASRISNFKNIPQSVARRHQRWQCYQLAKCNLLCTPLECGPGEPSSSLDGESDNLTASILKSDPTINLASSVFRPSWVRYEGILYKPNNCYLIKASDGLDPIFVKLNEILVIGNSLVVFIVQECKVLYFEDHYHSYAIEILPAKSVVYLENLYDRTVLHGHMINSIIYVGLKYYFLSDV